MKHLKWILYDIQNNVLENKLIDFQGLRSDLFDLKRSLEKLRPRLHPRSQIYNTGISVYDMLLNNLGCCSTQVFRNKINKKELEEDFRVLSASIDRVLGSSQ